MFVFDLQNKCYFCKLYHNEQNLKFVSVIT